MCNSSQMQGHKKGQLQLYMNGSRWKSGEMVKETAAGEAVFREPAYEILGAV